MQTQINNNFKSKVLKAAHKIFTKRYKVKSTANWSKALKKAWSWAKDKLLSKLICGNSYNHWSPVGSNLTRLYFNDKSYLQIFEGAKSLAKITCIGDIASSVFEVAKIAIENQITYDLFNSQRRADLSQISC